MTELPDIGARIRAAREAQGTSLRSVARELGVSASLLSQIETGKLRPSVRTLYQIVNFLGLSVDELLHTGRGAPTPEAGAGEDGTRGMSPVQYADRSSRIELTTGITWERLATGGNPGLENLLVTYGPHASSSGDGTSQRHEGWEFAYLISGALTLHIDDRERYDLRAGDSLSFDSRRPHHYVNPLDTESRAIFVITHDGTRPPVDHLHGRENSGTTAPPA